MPYFDYDEYKCYYQEIGEGEPLIFLHGNTASSKMFDSVLDLYKYDYKVILIDFLGNGKSDRLDRFPTDLWFNQGLQTIKFIEDKGYKKVNLLGSSGGALAAINVGLERPDLVNKIIADSFEGEKPLKEVMQNLKEEREHSKKDNGAKDFYYYMQGDTWECVVDNDTNAIIEHATKVGEFFHKPLEMLEIPILLTGSNEDEFLEFVGRNFYVKTYSALLEKIKSGKMHIFDKGGHPAILSNGLEFSKVTKDFLNE